MVLCACIAFKRMSFNLTDYLPMLLMFIVAAGFAVTIVGFRNSSASANERARN